ncbi:FAD-dependent monooxygenase [Actinoplanes awajinensis]|uniref:FAD-dependent oxidoreductase n=1 Tax=Actinoplanes awajinensis subsp. mycoplanecinus TaxID=135947 RepID=A0A101J903_9ACTN|nr:FAD-dependent monooxygenase [Actinoplanes awajinensis]KUL22426.1 FAD-dependent oxidoreductase [Actinoplanes awajinensis subsp. mycoplanecinus]
MTVGRVIIVGGGVAGTATALALHRAGIPAEVHEAHEAGGADAGAFLTLMGNGMAALAEIGATAAVEAVSYPAPTVTLWDAAGQQVGHRPIAGGARSITRAALYRALQQLATERGIPVRHGRRMTSAVNRADGVEVAFADGTTVAGDVLVGADGIRSRTRRLIDPAAPEPRFSGGHVIYGYAPGNPAGVDPDGFHMVHGSRAFFGFTAPGGDGRTWWFARVGGGQPGDSPASWRDRALDVCRDDATPLTAIITASGTDVIGGESYDIPTTPHWHNERMVLAGDAAHATTPAAAQGASMALQDAVALAGALGEHGDPAAAFTAYENLRRTETEQTVAASARLTASKSVAPPDPAA